MANVRGAAATRAAQRPSAATGVLWHFWPGLRKAVLTVHVAVSVALIGNTASVIVLALRASAADAVEANALYEGSLALAFALAIPLSFGALITGLLLGAGTPWGIVRYYWVVAKIGLLVAIILTGALLVGPSLQDLAHATADGREGSALGSVRWSLAFAGAANLVFMVTAVWLAVFKPWGRIRKSRRDMRS
jgi:hypothetical protein